MNPSPHLPAVIHATGLTKRFGRTVALDSLDLDLPSGSALALLGRNGAGKSTLIRILMGLTSPTSGDARVFGIDPRRFTEEHKARIGYIADGQDMPDAMTVGEYANFLRPFYPTWDDAFQKRLVHLFDLPLNTHIRHLSRGQRVKTAFVGALSFHPRLLLLDEPFSGLDPAVRDEVLDALFDLMKREEWTIFVSSHEIDEIERFADIVAVLDNGRLTLHEEKDALLARCRSVSLHTPTTPAVGALPETWWHPSPGEDRFTFLDSAHDAKRFETDIARLFPDAQNVTTEPAPLKTIVRALLHHTGR